MGIICERRRRQRAQRMRRRMMIAAGVLLLGAMAMSPQLKEKLAVLGGSMTPVFSQESAQTELTLPRREIYALQLGVFDSGERAAGEAQRLAQEGVRCIVWQREKMRIVCGVALSREGLDRAEIGNREAYVIKDVLQKVTLRVSAGAGEMDTVRAMLETPDAILMHLLTGEAVSLDSLIADTRRAAVQAQGAHTENALYTQLAQSLVNWCDMMEATIGEADEQMARGYAALTMCTLCRELRAALQASGKAG